MYEWIQGALQGSILLHDRAGKGLIESRLFGLCNDNYETSVNERARNFSSRKM